MDEIHGPSVLILGFGHEGKSSYRWLRRHYPTMQIDVADIHISDEDMASSLYKGSSFFTGDSYLSHVALYTTIVRSPGVSPYLFEVQSYIQNGGHVTSATNIFFSCVKGKTIGITGTKGKSTTTSLIAHILSSQYSDVRCVGNIGAPMLDALDTSHDSTVSVIELSSHQLVDCRYSPNVAVLLNIVPEHLDYYPDFGIYTRAKANITLYQRVDDIFVYNPIYPVVKRFAEHTHARLVRYGESVHEKYQATIKNGMLMASINDAMVEVVSLHDIPLLGNIENILAATSVASLFAITNKNMQTRIINFTSLPHRLEYVGEYNGIIFYNDSLSTIPQATIHALKSLRSRVSTLIAGGYDRHVEYKELGNYLDIYPVENLILFPDTGARIWDEIGSQTKKHIHRYDVVSMEEAVKTAFMCTAKGSICVLSPGSASYNMFRNYADRGDQFTSWIRKLG